MKNKTPITFIFSKQNFEINRSVSPNTQWIIQDRWNSLKEYLSTVLFWTARSELKKSKLAGKFAGDHLCNSILKHWNPSFSSLLPHLSIVFFSFLPLSLSLCVSLSIPSFFLLLYPPKSGFLYSELFSLIGALPRISPHSSGIPQLPQPSWVKSSNGLNWFGPPLHQNHFSLFFLSSAARTNSPFPFTLSC